MISAESEYIVDVGNRFCQMRVHLVIEVKENWGIMFYFEEKGESKT